ncbi:hypothetical protein Tco_0112724, partial [Tanacetum coccineum]
YALTHNPPVVFDSLVKQFWATAVVRPNDAGSHDLVATIDGRERQRVEHASSQSDSVPAATTHTTDDPDSTGGGSSNPAGSATPMASSAASITAGSTFNATGIDSTVTTIEAMDSAGSHRAIRVSPFADSATSSSP